MILFIPDKNPVKNYRPTILGMLVFEVILFAILTTVAVVWRKISLYFGLLPIILVKSTEFNIHYGIPRDAFTFFSIIICALISSFFAIKGIKIVILKLLSGTTMGNNFWNTYRLKCFVFLISIIINSFIFMFLEKV